MSCMEFLQKVIAAYKIDKEGMARLNAKIERVMAAIRHGLEERELKAQVILGGSAAKGTLLRDDFDVDIFVRFDYA
jgi:tRNA nucleotidyltransferase (CCA-adding enzyme)